MGNGRRSAHPVAAVVEEFTRDRSLAHKRFVVSGNRLTGGGISSGLDEALELIQLLFGKEVAESAQVTTQYFPKPPVMGVIPPTPQCMIAWGLTDARTDEKRCAQASPIDLAFRMRGRHDTWGAISAKVEFWDGASRALGKAQGTDGRPWVQASSARRR